MTFWPIYEELEHLNVPLLIHNGRMQPAGEIRCDSFTFVHYHWSADRNSDPVCRPDVRWGTRAFS